MKRPIEQRLWRSASVQGRPASYAAAGPDDGDPVVFVHGWGLSHRSYMTALSHLVDNGARVYAPALPGFGDTAPLPRAELTLAGCAAWLADFMEVVAVPRPATLVGHSFGGGVALQAAYDHPSAVNRLVLVNSIGGSIWKTDRTMRDRPLWDWGLHLWTGVLSPRALTRVLPVVATDAATNVVRHPRVLWEVGRLARDANLEEQLAHLRRRRLPIFILWGSNDRVIPLASAEALVASAEGTQLLTVPGDHNWLITDPNLFAELLTNVVGVSIDDARAPGGDAS